MHAPEWGLNEWRVLWVQGPQQLLEHREPGSLITTFQIIVVLPDQGPGLVTLSSQLRGKRTAVGASKQAKSLSDCWLSMAEYMSVMAAVIFY